MVWGEGRGWLGRRCSRIGDEGGGRLMWVMGE